jgi:hypothetical protein
MTTILQRPADAANGMFWAAPAVPAPINSQLVVGPEECVVTHLDRAILGVIPPGNHWLHPQPFPFLAPSVVGGANIRAELWFVRTSPIAGLQVGGSLGSIVDPTTQIRCNPRGFGEYSLTVADPALLVRSSLGMSATGPGPVVGWVSALVLNKVSAAYVKLVETERRFVIDPRLLPSIAQAVQSELSELGASGLAFGGLGNFQLSLPADQAEAIQRKNREAAAAARAAKVAEIERASTAAVPRACGGCRAPFGAGRFCTACGAQVAP